jgi:hypothetical protein
MITRTETVPTPPYHCGICRTQSSDYFIDTQVSTDEGAMYICATCFKEMALVSGEFIHMRVFEEEMARLEDRAKNNAALVEKFTRADRVLKEHFGLDFGNLLSLDEGQQNLRSLAQKTREAENGLYSLSTQIEEKQRTLAAYDSQIENANNIIAEKLREVDILNLPLDARLEAYHGSFGGIPVGVPEESIEADGNLHRDSVEDDRAVEADAISF